MVGVPPLWAVDSTPQAPTWVAVLEKENVSWDRATIAWQVGLSLFGGFGVTPAPVTVILESRIAGETEWTVLGSFPLKGGNHTNQTPVPAPPEILLPERILAPPPRTDSQGSVSGTNGDILRARYTHHRLAPDTLYEYRMKALSIHGEAPYSAILTVRTEPLPPPHPPGSLYVRNRVGTSLEVLWTRSNFAAEFLVERRQPSSNWQEVAVVEGTTHAWVDPQVFEGQTYLYRVRGRNVSGTSDPGPEHAAISRRLLEVFHDPVGDVFSPAWQEKSGVSLTPTPDDATANAIWFSGPDPRSLTTRPLVFQIGGFLEFDFRTDLSFQSGGEILVEATLDGRVWTILGRIDPATHRGRWRSFSIELPAAWSSSGIQFRFLQTSHGGEGAETWALKNIHILALHGRERVPPQIRIHTPSRHSLIQVGRRVHLAGTATDNHKIVRWAYSLNRGPWKSAALNPARETAWRGSVPALKRGRNLIRVRAYDAAGHVSATKTRIVWVRGR